jgi:single-stranded DNA-binding protein
MKTATETAPKTVATPAAIAVQNPIVTSVVAKAMEVIGTVGKQEYIKKTIAADGTAICKFSIGVNDRNTDVCIWHNIVVFGELAENTFANLNQGDLIKVVGNQKASEYTNKQSLSAIYVEISAYNIKVIATKTASTTVVPEVVGENDSIPF